MECWMHAFPIQAGKKCKVVKSIFSNLQKFCFKPIFSPLISKKSGLLIGVVSTGVGCARKGLPGIYTRISRYAKWVESNVLQY